MNAKNIWCAITIALCSSNAALAQGEILDGYNIWLGLDAGTIQSESENTIVESSKSGGLFGGKAIFSRFSETLMLEAGLGWQASRLRNKKPKPAATQADLDNGTVDREYVETRSGVGELGVRYRKGAFEVGVLGQILFGADTTYSPYIGVEDTTPNGNAGLAAYYTFYGKEVNQRLGVQLITDLTVEKRQVSSSILQYYVSLPILRPKSQEKVVVKYKEKTRYIVDAGFINFETNKFDIAEADKSYLAELGSYLNQNSEYWSLVFITSHTDPRGGDSINITLSKNRANAVTDALALSDGQDKKIQIRSKASNEPVNNKDDNMNMARNRRVEIELVGAINVVHLKRDIALIKQKHRKPDTCADDTCL